MEQFIVYHALSKFLSTLFTHTHTHTRTHTQTQIDMYTRKTHKYLHTREYKHAYIFDDVYIVLIITNHNIASSSRLLAEY